MLSLHCLEFSIEQETIFSGISLSFLPTAIVYLQGQNGAGKSSLLQMIAGIRIPSGGNITFGFPPRPITMLKKPYCTYIGHKYAIKTELTVLENIEFWAKLYNAPTLANAAISYFNLQHVSHIRCSELSAGIQKRVALARLVTCPSKLWLLDEADTNIDNENKHRLLQLIVSHADNGGIVFIASHNKIEIASAAVINLSDYTKR